MFNRYLVLCFVFIIVINLSACNRPAEETDQDQPRAAGDSEVIPAEADWARRIASLRLDDGGTNNGRTRVAVLEILYVMRERLAVQGPTLELSQDLDVVQDTVERMYASANEAARGEWPLASQNFATLQNHLRNNNLDAAQRTLAQLIIRLGG
jgi:hypothetical protein